MISRAKRSEPVPRLLSHPHHPVYHCSISATYEEIIAATFVWQQLDSHALNNWFLYHYKSTPGKLDIVLTVTNHQAVVSAVRHHIGLGIVVNHLVGDEIESGERVVIRNAEQQAVNRISVRP